MPERRDGRVSALGNSAGIIEIGAANMSRAVSRQRQIVLVWLGAVAVIVLALPELLIAAPSTAPTRDRARLIVEPGQTASLASDIVMGVGVVSATHNDKSPTIFVCEETH